MTKILQLINSRRLRDYPRLIFIASWSVLILNLLLHRGWIGGLTGVMIGGDFISNYSSGSLYLTDINLLYDPTAQQARQTSLIEPSQSSGFAPFISPPYVALAMSSIAQIPLQVAFIGWEILNLVCVLASVYLLSRYVFPTWLAKNGLSPLQLSVIIFSSFAFVIGFLAGQSHGITLLLCTGIISAMMKEKWVMAGLLGSILTYKPQFILGFLICWLAWRCMKCLLSFAVITLLWQLPILLSHGISPYLDYLNFSRLLLYLPYAKDSFPVSIMATPYALMSTLLPPSFAKSIQYLLVLLVIGMLALLSYIAIKAQKVPMSQRYFTLAMALLLPLLIAPHTLIYDLLILVPAFILLLYYQDLTQPIKSLAALFYACVLFLPLIGYPIKIALPGLLPIILLLYLLQVYFRSKMIAEGSL
jgi:hypothetical protein